MKTKKFLFAGLIGLISVLSACEKDEERVVMLENPVPPTLQTMPGLTLERVNANQTLIFSATEVDPGFRASANYFLEMAPSGTNFSRPMVLYSGIRVDTISIKVSDMNGMLLRLFPADLASSADFRVRAVMVVDAGTGALGSGATPLQFTSETRTVQVIPYGLPRLNLLNSVLEQKIESAAGDGSYSGFVKMDQSKPFTLVDPDTNQEYGGQNGILAPGGPAIVPPSPDGWYILSVDVNNLTFEFTEYRIGVVGTSTPNGWDGPDEKMDYDFEKGHWYITRDLIAGYFKFRRNDGWAFNFGYIAAPTIPLPWIDHPLQRGGVGNDFELKAAGNYTITLTIAPDEQSAKCSVILN